MQYQNTHIPLVLAVVAATRGPFQHSQGYVDKLHWVVVAYLKKYGSEDMVQKHLSPEELFKVQVE